MKYRLARFVAFALVYSAMSIAQAQAPSPSPSNELKTQAGRVAERAKNEWSAAWQEYKNNTNFGGAEDGTDLVPYINQGCSISAVEYWDPKMVWIARHMRARNSSKRQAGNTTRGFRRSIRDAMRKQSKLQKDGFVQWIVLPPEYGLTSKVPDAEIDLQQRAELVLFLNLMWTTSVQIHQADPTDMEIALKSILFHKLSCEFADSSERRLDEWLQQAEFPLTNQNTEIAIAVLANAISDPQARMERLQALSDAQLYPLSENGREVVQGFIEANS